MWRKSHKLREKIDIYAAGLVLFEMCAGFVTDLQRYRAFDDLRERRKFPKGFKKQFHQESNIILKMTEEKPGCRPSAAYFLNSSPEYQCYIFDLKVDGLF